MDASSDLAKKIGIPVALFVALSPGVIFTFPSAGEYWFSWFSGETSFAAVLFAALVFGLVLYFMQRPKEQAGSPALY